MPQKNSDQLIKRRTMKIIKKGKKKVSARRLTCYKCDCVFEYERQDLHEDQREPKPWVYCPCCNSAIDVEYWKDYE